MPRRQLAQHIILYYSTKSSFVQYLYRLEIFVDNKQKIKNILAFSDEAFQKQLT